MSSVTIHHEVCPCCKNKQQIERFDSVNDFDREVFARIVDKSIFYYKCNKCKKKIYSPYPLLFHRMGCKDIQIGYMIHPISAKDILLVNPLITLLRKIGKDGDDIAEYYDDVDKFIKRVKEFI